MLKKLFGTTVASLVLITAVQAQDAPSKKQVKDVKAVDRASLKEVSSPAPLKSPRMVFTSDLLTVAYGQPSKNGRVIFGELVPYAQVWRTGANMSTDITFNTDVIFGGKEVKAGTYALFTIPHDSEWKIILNTKSGQKGASEYEKFKDQNIAEVTVPVTRTNEVVEKLTIEHNEPHLDIMWDQTKVSIPVKKK